MNAILTQDDFSLVPPASMIWVERHYSPLLVESLRYDFYVDYGVRRGWRTIVMPQTIIILDGTDEPVLEMDFVRDINMKFAYGYRVQLPMREHFYLVPYLFKMCQFRFAGMVFIRPCVMLDRWNKLVSLGVIKPFDNEAMLHHTYFCQDFKMLE